MIINFAHLFKNLVRMKFYEKNGNLETIEIESSDYLRQSHKL